MEPFTFRNAYVPSADRLRERGEDGAFAWFEPSSAFVDAVRPVLARVQPYPAARLRGLDARAPEARVVAVVTPAAAATATAGGSALPWGLLAAGALATAAALAAHGLSRRLR
jgi:hypothetical protein